jgi:hypothetical protein
MTDDQKTSLRVGGPTAFVLLLGLLLMDWWVWALAALGIALLIAWGFHSRESCAKYAVAQTSGCPECGALLGRRAIEASDKAIEKAQAAFRAANPGVKRRSKLLRRHHAICQVCDTELRFDRQSHMFVRLLSAKEARQALTEQRNGARTARDSRRLASQSAAS